jgi:hypothetical protein
MALALRVPDTTKRRPSAFLPKTTHGGKDQIEATPCPLTQNITLLRTGGGKSPRPPSGPQTKEYSVQRRRAGLVTLLDGARSICLLVMNPWEYVGCPRSSTWDFIGLIRSGRSRHSRRTSSSTISSLPDLYNINPSTDVTCSVSSTKATPLRTSPPRYLGTALATGTLGLGAHTAISPFDLRMRIVRPVWFTISTHTSSLWAGWDSNPRRIDYESMALDR